MNTEHTNWVCSLYLDTKSELIKDAWAKYGSWFNDVALIKVNDDCVVVGITNHDEYSLVQELTDEEREKTLTLKRGQSIAKDQKKLDEMKKKLHTDDERKFHCILMPHQYAAPCLLCTQIKHTSPVHINH